MINNALISALTFVAALILKCLSSGPGQKFPLEFTIGVKPLCNVV